jgi:hypothetical protein
MEGLSPRNLRQMHAFHRTHRPTPDPTQASTVGQIGLARLARGCRELALDAQRLLPGFAVLPCELHCFVIIDLKEATSNQSTGKMNFYLSAVDDLLRSPEDKPTSGLLLCRSKRHLEVEYALRGIDKPTGMGVAERQSDLATSLPKGLASSLPTVEKIEAELRMRKSRVSRESSRRASIRGTATTQVTASLRPHHRLRWQYRCSRRRPPAEQAPP